MPNVIIIPLCPFDEFMELMQQYLNEGYRPTGAYTAAYSPSGEENYSVMMRLPAPPPAPIPSMN